MSSISRPVLGLLGAVATSLPASAAPADFLILESHGPSAGHFPQGSSLPDDSVILLRPGDRLIIQRSVGRVAYYGPAYFRLKDEPTLRETHRVGAPAGAGPFQQVQRRWLPPVLRRDPSESMVERGAREGFILCPGNPRCPG